MSRKGVFHGIRQRLPPSLQLRRRLGPRLAVAGEAVGPELSADRDQRRKVGHGLDGSGLGDPNEAVRIEVVAEEQRGVFVGRREETRAAVVQQVSLVDRLEPECVPLVGQRGEDRLALPFLLGPKRLGPEPALTRRLPRDRLPEVGRYNQAASSFVQ